MDIPNRLNKWIVERPDCPWLKDVLEYWNSLPERIRNQTWRLFWFREMQEAQLEIKTSSYWLSLHFSKGLFYAWFLEENPAHNGIQIRNGGREEDRLRPVKDPLIPFGSFSWKPTPSELEEVFQKYF